MFRSQLLTLEKLKSNVLEFELITLTSETENIVFSKKGKDNSLQVNNMHQGKNDDVKSWNQNMAEK